MTTHVLGVVLFVLVASCSGAFVPWDGTNFEQLVNKNIRLTPMYTSDYPNPKSRTDTRYVFATSDYPYWSMYPLATTPSVAEKINFKIVYAKASSYSGPSNYAYTGWEVKLTGSTPVETDVGVSFSGNIRGVFKVGGTPETLVFAHTTPYGKVQSAPFIYFINPTMPYPYGFTSTGGNGLLQSDQPIGHWGWNDYNMNLACIYKVWVEVPDVVPAIQGILIWKCERDGVNRAYYDDAVIQMLARSAHKIKIVSESYATTHYVETTSSSAYALDSLRLGKCLAFTPFDGYAITTDWQGPKLSSMWNSCLPPKGSFSQTPYWACNNGGGLHLTRDTCRWNLGEETPAGGISIYIERDINTPLIPVWSCYDHGKTNKFSSTVNSVGAMGDLASSITIYETRTPTNYVTANCPSGVCTSLSNAYTLSYPVSGGYVNPAEWTGTKTSTVWNNCGSNTGFLSRAYWACNNGGGMHLMDNACGWSSGGPTPYGGITIAIKPKTPEPASVERIWACNGAGVFGSEFSLSVIQQKAVQAEGILIISRNNPSEYALTRSSTVLAALRAGQTLSFSTSGVCTQTSDWTGPLKNNMWCSCGAPVSFLTKPYWACNNGGGLHLVTDAGQLCGWTSSTNTAGGIAILILRYSQ